MAASPAAHSTESNSTNNRAVLTAASAAHPWLFAPALRAALIAMPAGAPTRLRSAELSSRYATATGRSLAGRSLHRVQLHQ